MKPLLLISTAIVTGIVLNLLQFNVAYASHQTCIIKQTKGGDREVCTTNQANFHTDNSNTSYTEPSTMKDSDEDTFKLKDLVGTSINGMLDEACGGYCIVGACAHLNIGFSIRKGLYYYTLISPKIEHAMADLVISAYDDEGSEPLKEWRSTYGKAVGGINDIIEGIIKSPDGLQGGRSDSLEQGVHQTVSFKEVDIVGNPVTLLPDLVNKGSQPHFGGYQLPGYGASPTQGQSHSSQTQQSLNEAGVGFDANTISGQSLSTATSATQGNGGQAQSAIKMGDQIDALATAAQTIKKMKELMNVMLTATETSVRGSFFGNFINPRFVAPRLFCPTPVKAFQPYYLSFADSFWWRSGYPLTDGLISGTDYSTTIVNPLSTDTLQKTSGPVDRATKEVWGHLYPRDGSINQSHDAKAASVLAWRAKSVLDTSVKKGYRVGVALPAGSSHSGSGKWQMIFPEVKNCREDPYYAQGDDLTIDSLKPSAYGGYAWNYYRTYDCCSNEKGRKIKEVELPTKICLPLDDVLDGIEEDKAAYEAYLESIKNPPPTGGGNHGGGANS